MKIRIIVLIVAIVVSSVDLFADGQQVGVRIGNLFDDVAIVWSGVVGEINPENYADKGFANVRVEIPRLDGSKYTFHAEMPYIKVGNRLEVDMSDRGFLRGNVVSLPIPLDHFREQFGYTPEIKAYLE